MQSSSTRTLRLPLSGLIYLLRADGSWRQVGPAQYRDELAGRFTPPEEQWAAPDQPVERSGSCLGWPEAEDEEGWWTLHGDNRLGPVSVTLANGLEPSILTFGPLWLCEWVSTWQVATVTVGTDAYQMFVRRPAYLGTRSD